MALTEDEKTGIRAVAESFIKRDGEGISFGTVIEPDGSMRTLVMMRLDGVVASPGEIISAVSSEYLDARNN